MDKIKDIINTMPRRLRPLLYADTALLVFFLLYGTGVIPSAENKALQIFLGLLAIGWLASMKMLADAYSKAKR